MIVKNLQLLEEKSYKYDDKEASFCTNEQYTVTTKRKKTNTGRGNKKQ